MLWWCDDVICEVKIVMDDEHHALTASNALLWSQIHNWVGPTVAETYKQGGTVEAIYKGMMD